MVSLEDGNKRIIYLIFDTNILFRSNDGVSDYSVFGFNSNYSNMKSLIEKNSCSDKIKILIPEIVLNELQSQINKSFLEKREKLKEIFGCFCNLDRFDIKIPDDLNYENYIVEKMDEYLRENNLDIAPIPLDLNVFKDIIKRSITKNKPFSGKDKISDKGFKDVLLWESIIFYAIKNKGYYIFYTKNKEDFVKNLEIEFFKRTTNNITIFYEENELEEEILRIAEKERITNLEYIRNEIENGGILGNIYITIKEKYQVLYDDNGAEINVSKMEFNKLDNLHEKEKDFYTAKFIIEDTSEELDYKYYIYFNVNFILKNEKVEFNILDSDIEYEYGETRGRLFTNVSI